MTAPTQDAVTDVVLARQPIFDADLRDLRLRAALQRRRRAGAPADPAKATASVLVAALTDVGLERLVGNQRAFINVNREFLLSFRPLPLPADRVVLELVEDQIMDADLMDVLGELVTVGFTLALDNFSYRPEYEPLLRLAKIGKLNVQALTPEELAQHVRRLRDWDLQIIAEKVETREQLDYCRQLGIDGFQGYFFARPAVMAERSAPTFRLDALAKLIETAEDDFDALEEMISHDAGLSHKLLRLANSAHVAPRSRVRSIRHALSLLGGRTVRRWTMLLMLAGGHGQPHELLVTALVRARLCEKLAVADPAAEDDRGFTVGLFSIADALLHTPLPQLLDGLPFDDRLTGALLDHSGPEGRILAAALAYERGHFAAVAESHDLAALRPGVLRRRGLGDRDGRRAPLGGLRCARLRAAGGRPARRADRRRRAGRPTAHSGARLRRSRGAARTRGTRRSRGVPWAWRCIGTNGVASERP